MYQVRLAGGDAFDSVLESLRDSIPQAFRKYDPDSRLWRIFHRSYLDEWIRILEFYGDEVRIEWAPSKRQYQRPPDPPRRDPRAAAFEVLHLRESAPVELVAAARKILALKYHPDRPDGDLRLMQQVNAAADLILKA
jgi:hypothetical protein